MSKNDIVEMTDAAPHQKQPEKLVTDFKALREHHKDAITEINNNLGENTSKDDAYYLMHIKGRIADITSQFVYAIPDEKYKVLLDLVRETAHILTADALPTANAFNATLLGGAQGTSQADQQ